MTFDQFVSKWLGKKADYDGAYAGQCTDLFRYYVKEVLDFPQPRGVVGAKDFWTNYDSDPALNTNFKKIKNTPNGVPQKGDVVIWNKNAGGGFGHVAIFLEGDVNGFTSFDQNWPTLSKCTRTRHDYKNVSGWFQPKQINEPTPLPKFDINADLTSEIENDAGLKGYRWYDNKWSFKGLVEFTDALDRENEGLRSELAEAQNHTPTLQEAIKVLLSYIGVK